MTNYDSSLFDPPAPVAVVDLSVPASGSRISGVPALIDTGADITTVPQAVVSRLGLPLDGSEAYELVDFAGQVSYAASVELTLTFCSRDFTGRFLLVDQPWAIVGRNVLNRIGLVFDGPNLRWDEFGRH